MKGLLGRIVIACALAVVIFAAPTAAQAAEPDIAQSPNTTGMVYEAGSWLSVSWTCAASVPETANVTLYLVWPSGIDGIQGTSVASDLSVNGGIEVQVPSDGGPYFYYLAAQWVDQYGEPTSVLSQAYWDWAFGSPWWFTLGTQPTVLQQPEGQSVYVGDNATFTTSVEGTPTPDVQWQVDDGTGWADIPGATSEMYTTPETTGDMSGWRYRAYVSNVLGSTYTNEVELTVLLAGSTITQTPNTTGLLYEAGSELTISWTSMGVPDNAEVALKLDRNSYGTILTSTIATDLARSGTTTVTIPAEDGTYLYYVEARWPDPPGTAFTRSNAYGDLYNAPWWFSVGHRPTIGGQPESQTVVLGETASFLAFGAGSPGPSIQWQVDDGTGWADIPGATSSTFTTPATTANMNGWQYRAVLTNALGSATSITAQLTVILSPTVTQHPTAQTAAAGATATFVAAAVGDPTPSVHWEVNDGTGWTDVAGATSASYTTPATTDGMHGWQYRAVFDNSEGTATSNAATLTVLQSVMIGAPSVSPSTPRSRRQASFTATVTPVAAVDDVTFTLHFLHWETRRVNGVRVEDWYEYPSTTLSVTNASTGTLGGTAAMTKRGDWKMYVTSSAVTPWQAGQSSETLFTVK